jgi:hypothetical protein
VPHRARRSVPNLGGGPRTATPPGAPQATYRLSGPLRWVDPGGLVAAVLVQRANSAGRRLAGETVTVDLQRAQVSAADRNGDGRRTGADLLPGEPVTVTARLPRGLTSPPPIVAARRLATYGALR